MRRPFGFLSSLIIIALTGAFVSLSASRANAEDAALAPQPEREWTFLVYLNGHNSLDRFGIQNIRDMEKVGSTDKVNVVVQWASYRNPTTQRLFVQKQNDPSSKLLASTLVQQLPTVDMGDYHSFVEFVKWGAQNFPAKHIFVNVWNHGGGWHLNSSAIHTKDISWDDRTGHVIKTEELGVAMAEIASAIGHKVDLYGSDACLMGMVEVASEMKDSVETFVGSQEVEPGAGWPYDVFLSRWNALLDASSQAVAKTLAHAYVESYMGGSNGTADATMSVYDISKTSELETAVKNFGAALSRLSKQGLSKTLKIASRSQSFAYADYVDLVDFVAGVEKDPELATMASELTDVKAATSAFTTFNEATPSFQGANGVSIWLPTDRYTRNQYFKRYTGLIFDRATSWSTYLGLLTP